MKKLQFHDIYFPDRQNTDMSIVVQQDMETGYGEMICYDVVPGIKITYNCLNMDSCYQTVIPEHDFLQIDHCLEGCYECELPGGIVSFLGEGDLCVSSLCKGTQIFTSSKIPLKKYRGITVLLEMEKAQETLNADFRQADIDLKKIRDALCADGRSLLIKSKHEVDHIFGELYCVDERIRHPYLWVKVIELLLFLSLLDASYVKNPGNFQKKYPMGRKRHISILLRILFQK